MLWERNNTINCDEGVDRMQRERNEHEIVLQTFAEQISGKIGLRYSDITTYEGTTNILCQIQKYEEELVKYVKKTVEDFRLSKLKITRKKS